MNHSQKQLFEIAKKLLIFSGTKGKISTTEKKKLLPQLSKILKEIESDSSNMSIRVQKFLKDIIGDIENDRLIDIDSISEDDYLENFMVSESLVLQYNTLLGESDYKQIIKNLESKNFKDSLTLVENLNTHTNKILKAIDRQKFSKLLLILNIFKISKVLTHYVTLYKFSLENGDLKTSKALLNIISSIKQFHRDIHTAGLENIENNTIESTYMRCDIKNNKLSLSPTKVSSDKMKNLEYKNIFLDRFFI